MVFDHYPMDERWRDGFVVLDGRIGGFRIRRLTFST